jgi:hypothetical protein
MFNKEIYVKLMGETDRRAKTDRQTDRQTDKQGRAGPEGTGRRCADDQGHTAEGQKGHRRSEG